MDNKVLIIAEAGLNHNGNLITAKKLADVAKESGADIVKFQTLKSPQSLVSKYARAAEYQKKNTGREESQLELLDRITLPMNDFKELSEYCDHIGIRFLSTPFDISSIDYLQELGVGFWKIPSGEITNYPYLVHIANTHKDIVLSTGMSTLEEICEAYRLLKENGAGDITLLHCTTEYPAPIEDVNLKAMVTLREKFGCNVGYSDHTQGIEVALAAVAMGATVIEKHFTLNRNMEGPDHKASLEPDELRELVNGIRKIESALGDGVKRVSDSEKKNRDVARKSIIASRDIAKGEVFSEDNLTTKRPGSGISPMLWNQVIGTSAERDYKVDELIEM
jgi:N,N'-diacetyllegionaminate synthase